MITTVTKVTSTTLTGPNVQNVGTVSSLRRSLLERTGKACNFEKLGSPTTMQKLNCRNKPSYSAVVFFCQRFFPRSPLGR
jgi:hypothetical protein